jgi:hypothetical protein
MKSYFYTHVSLLEDEMSQQKQVFKLSWEKLYKFVNYLDDEQSVLPKLDGGGKVCLLQEGSENV